jgi:hypothetical protein
MSQRQVTSTCLIDEHGFTVVQGHDGIEVVVVHVLPEKAADLIRSSGGIVCSFLGRPSAALFWREIIWMSASARQDIRSESQRASTPVTSGTPVVHVRLHRRVRVVVVTAAFPNG